MGITKNRSSCGAIGLDEEEGPRPGLGDACSAGAFLSPTARLRAGGVGNSGDDENGLAVSDPRSEAALARKRKTPPGGTGHSRPTANGSVVGHLAPLVAGCRRHGSE